MSISSTNWRIITKFRWSIRKKFLQEQKKGRLCPAGKLDLYFRGKKENGWQQSVEYHPWQVTENFFLPASYGKIVRKEYRKTAKTHRKRGKDRIMGDFTGL